ncbi:Acyl-CoA dehydrogenase [Catalinimonas alkaloidigena]|uniref:Acyl-CoA dehydrogenase n=1 Tax=Catalinimonas alkaloidigena TaxID=1075417 RepID=A0A1G9RPG5_9BACT|nr:acyl-CoA dehydrogenase family protein [Catalinimonas alkaloidigena]SDM25084.1 Acyl-CoA dehydrogenase [Catalinimonas alkaloidigena]
MEHVIAHDWIALVEELGPTLATNAATADQHDTFVQANYALLKEHRFFSALIPEELGGAGSSHRAMCDTLRTMAHYCSSTALALSMHQHLVAANVWKYKRGQGAADMLQKVAAQQLILVSTGAGDWLESSGQVEKTEGGYLVTAQKHFASQAPVGNVLVTSAPYEAPEAGWQVLHFPVPFRTEGLTVLDDWYTLGMRGTGSHTVRLDRVFVPESAIVLKRPRGTYHPVWNVILTVAMPLIMAVYVGIAERAEQLVLATLRAKAQRPPHVPYLVGEMHNALTTARVLWQDTIRLCQNFDFQPEDAQGIAILTRKTEIANAAIRTVEKAMEALGGASFFRHQELERLFRDVKAGPFHPLPEKPQQRFTGDYLLDPAQTLSFF